ncbi:MAG: exonuclease SbcCD subunit D [Butyrivibrio sp.]|nr:exonuclease SbcCD subunit D [Butyrivibrio sp.]
MKFIHLSDLHLGKRVNEFSMLEDQRYIVKEILTIISSERPDGVLVAGDVYDRSVPSEEAMQLWDEFLISLAEKKIPLYAISGNHDSAVRFSDHSHLVETAGIHLSPVYSGNTCKYTLEGSDEYGRLNIFLLPFIKPSTVRALFPDDEIETYTDACRVAVEHMDVNEEERNILVAHQFVTGALRCDSEEIVVGGLDNVDASVFDVFDYVALGHIHGKQSIGRETVRYCGTPLKYSFSEKDHKKSVTVIEIANKNEVKISEIPLVPKHDLRQIKGKYDELMLKKNYEGTATDDYIHAVLTDEEDVIDAAARLRVIYPNLMKLSYDNARTRNRQEIDGADDTDTKSPVELFSEFYEKQNNQEMSAEQTAFVEDQIQRIWG